MFKRYIEGKTAAFFDLDGTIIDSLPYWEEALSKVYSEITDGNYVYAPMIRWGNYLAETWEYILDVKEVETDYKIDELVTKTQNAYLELFKENPLEPRDGFWDLVYELKELKKFKLALISNSNRAVVNNVADIIGIRENVFHFTITGDEVKKRKPHPDIYQKAMKEMGLKASEVLVFEDTVTGATAADKAGLDLIIIWDGAIKEREYPGNIFTFLPDFSGLPGNLDKEYYEALKGRVDELEEENTAN
jgi:HAD superfamily hydrolase (TIGR01509 family)